VVLDSLQLEFIEESQQKEASNVSSPYMTIEWERRIQTCDM
jgi:hypothetical protein